MPKFFTMEKIVLQVLEENPMARQDDYILMLKVCEKTNPEATLHNFGMVMKNHHFFLPNWETITRCRRKIQAKRPDLIAPETARKRRKEEEEYREYAHT